MGKQSIHPHILAKVYNPNCPLNSFVFKTTLIRDWRSPDPRKCYIIDYKVH
ncbi:hypothetical protein PL9214291195 [Planktothrix tepida PCC 9214]|uniref:Uncharacterized protein n=1 Tax=Planktothrix tepida PCC 9214 TaxID=671072 RepID=A0A1J1LI89_9CYAN|nr:hypothetical protein PL9214291195 [Planktothrix tepida PCC 9214]